MTVGWRRDIHQWMERTVTSGQHQLALVTTYLEFSSPGRVNKCSYVLVYVDALTPWPLHWIFARI
jgi:hypothetical protein